MQSAIFGADQDAALGVPNSERLKRFQRAFEHAAIGMLIVERDGCFIEVNGALCAMLGRAELQLRNLKIYDVIHPDDSGRAVVRQALSGGREHIDIELRYLDGAGQHRWGRLIAWRDRDSRGRSESVIAQLQDITAQKQAEEELRLQQALLTAMVETSLDGIVINSEGGTVRAANRQLMRLWNIPGEELVGTSSAALHEHCVVQVADQADAQAGVDDLHARRGATGRKELLLKDGRTLDRFSSPVVGPDGVYHGRVWHYRDSTERSRMERELRASERQLAEAQRLVGLGSWEWDGESGEVRWSDECFRILGIEPDSVRPTFELLLYLVRPHDRERLTTAMAATFEGGAPYQLDFAVCRPDGSERILQGQGEIVRDEHGATIGMRGTMLDVTVRQALESQLARQALLDPLTGLPNRRSLSNRLDAALDPGAGSSDVALLFIDLDNFKDVNDQLGHDAGDDVLVEVAERLRRCIRERDLAVRLGGDEFVVLLDRTCDFESAVQVADRLLAAISEPISTARSGVSCSLTASIGIVLSDDATRDSEDLLHASDAAMYAAKSQGKARWIAGCPLPTE